MSFFGKNLRLLAGLDGPLYERIAGTGGAGTPRPMPPLNAARTFDVSGLDPDKDLLVFYGIGGGEHIAGIFQPERRLPGVIVIEPDTEIFIRFLHNCDLSAMAGRTVVFAVDEFPGDIGLFVERAWKFFLPPSIRLAALPEAVSGGLKSYFDKVSLAIREICVSYDMNVATLEKFGLEWMRNFIRNTGNILSSPGIGVLKGAFSGLPVFIAGAGPSLSKNVSALKKVGNRGLIISSDTAFPVLAGSGIRPDLIVSIDSLRLNTNHLKYCDTDGIYLAAYPTINPAAFGLFSGRTFLALSGNPVELLLKDMLSGIPVPDTGGSVTTIAFFLARLFGAGAVIMAGQDFAYSGGLPYSRGTYFLTNITEVSGRHNTAESLVRNLIISGDPVLNYDNYGVKHQTTGKMLNWKKWFEYKIRDFRGSCVDSTEGGLSLKGFEEIPLEKAVDKFCLGEYNKKMVFEDARRSSGVRTRDDLARELGCAASSLARTIGLIEEAARLLERSKRAGGASAGLLVKASSLSRQVIADAGLMQVTRWVMEPVLKKMETIKGDDAASFTARNGMFLNAYARCLKMLSTEIKKVLAVKDDRS